MRPVRNVFQKLSRTEQRREGAVAYLWGTSSQAGSKIPTMCECISSLSNLLNTCRKVSFKEKPTVRVWCLYSPFVHAVNTFCSGDSALLKVKVTMVASRGRFKIHFEF